MTLSTRKWALDLLLKTVDMITVDEAIKAATTLEAFLDAAAPDMQPRPIVVNAPHWVIVMAGADGLKSYFNGFAGGLPACTTHVAGAIRFAREQDASWMIESFGEGFPAHQERLDLEP